MKIAVIGCGNMGSAIIGGLIKAGTVSSEEITASDKSGEMRRKAAEAFGIKVTESNPECVKGAELIILAVKPNVFRAAAEDLAGSIKKDQIVLSIAAGKKLADMADFMGKDKKLVRAMPNTPALVGEGITAFCPNENVTEEDKSKIFTVLSAFSEAEEVPEDLMSVVTSVSGSSPAYVFMFIEAMADAAVADGMPRKQAYHFAAQTVLGSAKMVLETGRHPGELKDMVCSPGGTTIEGVAALEKGGFRTAVIEAVRSCTRKAKNI
ncbi:MAG TPA: pyrroline-5-carboxylate reductase [Lachnospiraceae bacterium]|nr:pyrroline-5-carboxylate reductase [Lachnospiraceae bacterium]